MHRPGATALPRHTVNPPRDDPVLWNSEFECLADELPDRTPVDVCGRVPRVGERQSGRFEKLLVIVSQLARQARSIAGPHIAHSGEVDAPVGIHHKGEDEQPFGRPRA